MTFFEQKKQAEADGMVVSGKTTKADIVAFYETKEPVAVTEVKEPEVVVKEVIVEVEKACPHFYEFVGIQASRLARPVNDEGKTFNNAQGQPVLGKRIYKDKYVCSACGEVEFRDGDK